MPLQCRVRGGIMVLIVRRVRDDEKGSQQPGGQIAARRDADSLIVANEFDGVAELQLPVIQSIGVHNHRGKHEWMQLANEDIQALCDECDAFAPPEGGVLVEGHVGSRKKCLTARVFGILHDRPKQTREGVNRVGGVRSIVVDP